jgi:acetate kinase
MNILVINAGSSSLKFQYINPVTGDVLIKGLYDGLNRKDHKVTLKLTINDSKETEEKIIDNHSDVVNDLLSKLIEKKIILDLLEIKYIGHRVVHGAEDYSKTTEITDSMLRHLKAISFLAPLHNPINIEYIEILKEKLKDAKQFAVFDTAFHQTIPPEIYLYGLPKELYEKYKIRKYGFHGLVINMYLIKQANY